MDRHLEALAGLLEPLAAHIQTLNPQFEKGINCVGYYRGTHPGFHLSAGLISRLHALSLDVDFDLYCCVGEPEA